MFFFHYSSMRLKCGAKTRKGIPCKASAVWHRTENKPVNGRCRFHGGLSTGPKTTDGKERVKAASSRGMKRYWILVKSGRIERRLDYQAIGRKAAETRRRNDEFVRESKLVL